MFPPRYLLHLRLLHLLLNTWHRPMNRRGALAGLVCLLWVLCAVAWVQPSGATPQTVENGALASLGLDPIFLDDFESGSVVPWSNVVGLIQPPDAFRTSVLRLRDPHVFVDISPLCWDFTDTPIPLTDISFNGNLAQLIESDGDGDMLLDLSLLLLFRPLEVLAVGQRLDFQDGACSAPLATTACQVTPGSVPSVLSYDGLAEGICSQALAGTTGGYSPPVPTVAAPCFASQPQTLVLDLLGVPVELQQAQIAATFAGDPVSDLTPGLLQGFLSESDADALLLPAELPIIGGQPLSVLLPGGSGNCAAGDDRDLLDGVPGWWFYLEMQATTVPFSE